VRPTARAFAAAAAAVLASACGGSTAEHPHGSGEDVLVCEPGFTTPEGFSQTEALEDPYADHVAIRLGFVDDTGRELHYFAGVPGEFGEGLPVVARVEAAGGIEGPLQGRAETWVLSWRAPGPCGVRAVLGNGFTREAFLETLERAGIIPQD
jgi:hypothetical protein